MNELQPCISQHWLLTGAETSTYCVHGLWERPLGDFTAFLRKEGFNALRLPLSAELMLNLDGTQPNGINFQANPELQVHLVVYFVFASAAVQPAGRQSTAPERSKVLTRSSNPPIDTSCSADDKVWLVCRA